MTFETLTKGMRSEHVADLRGRLVFLGLLHPPVADVFDDDTELAVWQYQGGGDDASVVVDESVWLRLCNDTDGSGYSFEQARAGAYDAHRAEATTTTHEHSDLRPRDIRSDLLRIADKASAMAGQLAVGIESACQFFEAYATERLAKIDHARYTGSDYLKYLTRHLTGEVGKELTGALTVGLAATGIGGVGELAITSIWIACSMEIERGLGNAAKGALADDQHDLAAAIPALVARLTSEFALQQREATKRFTKEIDRIVGLLDANVPLGADVAWVEPLVHANAEASEEFISHYVGIPTDWVPVRDVLYQKLVAAFEEMVLEETERGPFDAAAASLLGGVHGTSAAAMEQPLHDDRHRRAEAAADDAVKNRLPHERPAPPQR